MTVRIRRAVREDGEAVARLAGALNKQAGGTGPFDAAVIRRDAFGADPRFAVVIAETEAGLVGYALCCDAYETGNAAAGYYLCDLFVEPAVRRQGIGRRLIAAVARLARESGRSFVWWAAREAERDAEAFYDTLGTVAEPVVAHALVLDVFEALAREAQPLDPA